MDDISQENQVVNDLSLLEKQRLETDGQDIDFYAPHERILLHSNPTSSSYAHSNISLEPATTHAKGIPSDPGVISGNFWEQWHHTGEHGLNAMPVWDEYTGEGVRVGILDDGFNYNHSELSTNFRTDLDYDVLGNDTNSINNAGDNHGTYVAQILAGDDNGSRTVGVAFDADIVGIRRGFDSQSSTQDTVDAFDYALANNFDVMNNSWGMDLAFADNTKVDFIGTDTSAVTNAIQNLAEQGRDGLGANLVFSAGNQRQSGMSANYKNYQNSPYTITVGAIKEDGTFADFSEAGSNLLVTAAGDSLYVANPTDTNSANIISGTSFSAPAVSGVVALMLEANADLGYRDVQEILAMSARQTDSNGTGWAGAGWQTNGATNWNGGGMHFSHDYGFGNIDALAAVRMAETWSIQQTAANMTTIPPVSGASSVAIPSVGTITTTLDIVQDISIEHILIDLDISHSRAGDLVVTLTSPDGTESVLMYRVENGAYTTRYGITGVDFEFSSTAHWGESSAGDWTLTIEDVASGNAGTLNDWSLEFLGGTQSNDDLYIYTNEYAGSEGARTVLSDTDGGNDTINAAAVSGDTVIDLNFGGTIANTIFIIDAVSVIENIYTGDGNDTLTGNDADNVLYGGRGDDIFYGSQGDDEIDGAVGDDSVSYDFDISNFLIDLVDATTVVFEHIAHSFTDTLSNIESFVFNDGAYTRAELDDYVANGGGQPATFVDTRLTLGWETGGYNQDNFEEGNYTYTGEDIGQAGNTNSILSVERGTTSLTSSVLQPNAIDTVTLRNDDLTSVSLTGFRSLWLDQNLATKDLSVSITQAMRGTVDAGAGNDTINITLSEIAAFDPNDIDVWNINTGAGDDAVVISGTITNMYGAINLGAGDDTIDINVQGNDRIYGEEGNDTISVGNGNDVLEGGSGSDTLNGEAGNDILRGGIGSDVLNGGVGFDRLEGGDGNDTLYGGAQADRLFGDAGSDTLHGGSENDVLRGGEGDDFLYGDAGNDQIYGDVGNDQAHGGIGRDFIRGGDGSDVLHGNEDSDKLYGDADDDTLYGDAGFDTLYGGLGNDTLYGGADNDRLYGQDGNDRLEGGDGGDYLYAGTGTDILIGGTGADRLYGDNTSQDIFGLSDIGTGIDRIYNFTNAQDVLNITDLLTGYNHGIDDLNDFVQLLDLGNGTTDLRINADGDAGGSYGRVALIYNDLGGASVDDLITNGSLIADQTL